MQYSKEFLRITIGSKEYVYTARDDCSCRYIALIEDGAEVASVNYALSSGQLHIQAIERTLAGRTSKAVAGRYYGTEVFGILLMHLKRRNECFMYIGGELAVSDAKQNNWKDSIPFYYNLPTFLPHELGYTLKYSLFDSSSAKENNQCIEIPSENTKSLEFVSFIQGFTRKHLEKNYCAYFRLHIIL